MNCLFLNTFQLPISTSPFIRDCTQVYSTCLASFLSSYNRILKVNEYQYPFSSEIGIDGNNGGGNIDSYRIQGMIPPRHNWIQAMTFPFMVILELHQTTR